MKTPRQIQAWRRSYMLFQLKGMISKLEKMEKGVRSSVILEKIRMVRARISILYDLIKSMTEMNEEELKWIFKSTDWHTAFKDD